MGGLAVFTRALRDLGLVPRSAVARLRAERTRSLALVWHLGSCADRRLPADARVALAAADGRRKHLRDPRRRTGAAASAGGTVRAGRLRRRCGARAAPSLDAAVL